MGPVTPPLRASVSPGITTVGSSQDEERRLREALGTVTLPLCCYSVRLRLEVEGSHPSLAKCLLATFEKSTSVAVLSFPSVTRESLPGGLRGGWSSSHHWAAQQGDGQAGCAWRTVRGVWTPGCSRPAPACPRHCRRPPSSLGEVSRLFWKRAR